MSVRATALLIFLLSLWSFAALAPQGPANDQVITRLALDLAIVDSGSVEITRFADWTVDKAKIGDRFYADKTPGHPLLALPAVALAKVLRLASGAGTNARDPEILFDYAKWATLGSNCLISALAVAALFLTAVRLGASRAGALFAACALSLATPFFGWSTAFFAHSVTGSLLIIALALILGPRDMPAGFARSLGLGLLLGYCCVVDLTAAPAVALLGAYALFRAFRNGRLLSTTAVLFAGGVVGLVPLLVYNQLAFGSPLHLGYADTAFDGMQQGFFGISWPHPAVLVQLLVGPYRGLLPLSPVLLLVPFGLVAMFRRPDLRGPAAIVTLIVIGYLWINSSYYYWNGGFSTGPRHLIATLPLAALALAFAWPSGAVEKAATMVLLAVSLALSLACALAGMFAPDTMLNPFAEWIVPNLSHPAALARGVLILPVWLAYAALLARADAPASFRTGSAAGRPAPAA